MAGQPSALSQTGEEGGDLGARAIGIPRKQMWAGADIWLSAEISAGGARCLRIHDQVWMGGGYRWSPVRIDSRVWLAAFHSTPYSTFWEADIFNILVALTGFGALATSTGFILALRTCGARSNGALSRR